MRRVEFSPRGIRDLERVRHWLLEKNPDAAERAADAILAGARTLSTFAERGHGGPNQRLREILIPFGSAAYVIQYRIEPDRVIVARIRHSRERR